MTGKVLTLAEKARKYAERQMPLKRYPDMELVSVNSGAYRGDMEAAYLAGYRAAKREAKMTLTELIAKWQDGGVTGCDDDTVCFGTAAACADELAAVIGGKS